MPPRLLGLLPTQQLNSMLSRTSRQTLAATNPSPLSSLVPHLPQHQHQHQQQTTRQAHILASLSDTPGAYNKRIRRGRGPASGKGKTSGRGHKGQKQHGKVPAGFNGGQTPEIVVHGERGFKNHLSIDLAVVNLSRIQDWIDQGRIDPTRPITIRELAHSRCIHQAKEGVKILGGSDAASALKQPVHIVVSRASMSAIAAVEAAGGSLTTRYYTHDAVRRILRRETHPFWSAAWSTQSGSEALTKAIAEAADAEIVPSSTTSTPGTTSPAEVAGVTNAAGPGALAELHIMKVMGLKYRLPDPTNRRDIEYYRDPAHRGYLSHLLKPMEGPSLFFRSPAERKSAAGIKKEKILPENRLW